MRKLIVLLTMLGLLSMGVPLRASNPGVGAIAYQFADAFWIKIKGDGGTFHFAVGARFAWDGIPVTFGAVGKGKCEVERSRHFKSVTCYASGRTKEIPFEDFQIDPLLATASLKLKSEGRNNRVQWKGKGKAPSFGVQADGGGTSAQVGGGLGRSATAFGKVLGKRFAKGSDDWSLLFEGANASAYSLFEDFSDGTFEFERTFKVPR